MLLAADSANFLNTELCALEIRSNFYKVLQIINKMQFIVLCLCACALTVVGQDTESMQNMPKYDSRYDYLDVDGLFNNKRLVRNYVDCLVNGHKCTPEGKVLKRLLPEALRTKCVRCTERQKKIAVKIIKRLKLEYPEEWAKLSSKWDPTGDFTRYFEVFLANEQFNTIPLSNGNDGNDLPAPTLAPRPTLTAAPTMPPTTPATTPPRPIILNRFGEDGELMTGSPSSAMGTPRTTTPTTPTTPTTTTTMGPMQTQTRFTPMSWDAAASNSKPTKFPARPTTEFMLTSTASTILDQIGLKIMRTTELITDIFRNTVRAVVGR